MRPRTPPQPRPMHPHGKLKQMVKPGEATINRGDQMWINADDLANVGLRPGDQAWVSCDPFDGVFYVSRRNNWPSPPPTVKLKCNKTKTAGAVYMGGIIKRFGAKRGQYVGRFPLTHAFRLGQPTLRIQVRPQKVVTGPLRGPPPPPVATAKVA